MLPRHVNSGLRLCLCPRSRDHDKEVDTARDPEVPMEVVGGLLMKTLRWRRKMAVLSMKGCPL